jgi:hypothetical protein
LSTQAFQAGSAFIEEAKPEQVSFSTKPCPCGVNGGKHAPWRCWEMYDEYKPATYERNQARKQKWDKAIKADPAWKARVDKKHITVVEMSICLLASGFLASGFLASVEKKPNVGSLKGTKAMGSRYRRANACMQ